MFLREFATNELWHSIISVSVQGRMFFFAIHETFLFFINANNEDGDEDDKEEDYDGKTDDFDEENDLEDVDEKEDDGDDDDDKRKQLTIHLQLQLVHWQGRREGGMQ